MENIDASNPEDITPVLIKLKEYLKAAVLERAGNQRYVFVPTSDLASAPAVFALTADRVVASLGIYLVGNPVPGNEASQEAARAILKSTYPIVYTSYLKSIIKEVNEFLLSDLSQGLKMYGYTSWAERNKVMHLEEYIVRLTERMAQEGFVEQPTS